MEDSGSKNDRSVRGRGKSDAKRGRGAKSSVLSDTDRLIALLKANKVEHYKSGEVEIKFSMLAFLPDAPEKTIPKAINEDDELLYYSAPERRME